MKSIYTIIATLLTCSLGASALGAPTATAEIHPEKIPLGGSARLVVKVASGDSGARPSIPKVDGLRIQVSGQSSQIRIVNGRTSSSVNFSYHVEPTKTGEFEIPAINVRTGGQSVSTEPVKLSVVASSNAIPGGLSTPGTAASPSTTTPAPEDLAFLRVERVENGGRDHLYVGEMTPIAVRAYFREGVQVTLNSKPSLVDSAFTLRAISEDPKQETTVVNGKRYRVLTWFAGLTGVKAGDFQIEATIDATLGVPQRGNRRPSPFGSSGFNDPFFDSIFDDFFARVARREVTLTSEKFPVAVKALPADGRPDHFDGAVGQFEISSFSIPAEVQTGDPATLKVTVDGKGNFDRLSMPHLQPEEGWKVYGAKNSVEPTDILGFGAKKTFELPVIALEPGEREVSFSLAYFDPEAGEYRTAESESVPVTIGGTAIAATSLDTPTTQPAEATPSEAIAPARDHPGRLIATFRPLYGRPWFVAGQGAVSLALLASLGMIGVRRHRDRHPEIAIQRATTKVVNEQLRAVELAFVRQDAPEFFAAARRALQLKLGALWNCNPDAITSEDVSERPPAAATSISRIFRIADEVEFSGARPDPASFEEWQQRLKDALEELDRPGSEASQPEATAMPWGVVPTGRLTQPPSNHHEKKRSIRPLVRGTDLGRCAPLPLRR